MRVLVFDTETSGLPESKIISPDTLHLWPHIVQFSYIIYDTEKNEIVMTMDDVIKVEDNVTISQESINLHGITKEISQEKGVKLSKILHIFCNYLKTTDVLVGHNVTFDIQMVKVELLRLIYSNMTPEDKIKKYKNNLSKLSNFTNIYCTMQNTIELCSIKKTDKYGKEYNKYPKLIELHQKLFNTIPNHLHNSLNDILVTLRCFVQLKYDVDLNKTCGQFIEKTKQIFHLYPPLGKVEPNTFNPPLGKVEPNVVR
jgi:DNA polymerase III epsilon subunit-like protein